MSLPITTERLIIRPFTPADFEAIHAVWSDPAVMGPIPSQAYDREQSWARLTGKLRHQARHGFSKWAVAEQASGTVIGECGVHYLEDGPDIELGYKLARACWRQGFAEEAARACLDWALGARPERVVAIVDPANTRSARILSKLGMVQDGTFSRCGHTWDFYVAIRCRHGAGLSSSGPVTNSAAAAAIFSGSRASLALGPGRTSSFHRPAGPVTRRRRQGTDQQNGGGKRPHPGLGHPPRPPLLTRGSALGRIPPPPCR